MGGWVGGKTSAYEKSRWDPSAIACVSPSRSDRCSYSQSGSARARRARQFILIGGDAGIRHFFYRHNGPITAATPRMAYPGCYALSKVLEEVMLEQFGIQYGINGCCLRAPWIMEKDDFRYTLSFGEDVFGGPDWKTMVPAANAKRYAAELSNFVESNTRWR